MAEAEMCSPIAIRPVAKAGFRECVQISREVFGFADVDLLPAWIMHTSALNGGLVLGAYIDDELIGCSCAIPGFDGHRPFLLSLGLQVRPAYANRRLGAALKLAQRDHALRLGYTLIKWTVEPLAARPIYLYLSKLGARLVEYHSELYEEFRLGGIDSGLVADEAGIEWDLHRVASRAPPAEGVPTASMSATRTSIRADGARGFDGWDAPTREGASFVEIPWDLGALKRAGGNLATEWRIGVRDAMSQLLSSGMVGTGAVLDRAERRCFVRFERVVR